MRVTSRYTSVFPSRDLNNYLTSLLFIGLYAKILSLPDLYCQSKDIYDKAARQYNDKYCPQKGFWGRFKDQFKENITFGTNITSYTPVDYFEEIINSADYVKLYDFLKAMPINSIQKDLNESIKKFNQKYGE